VHIFPQPRSSRSAEKIVELSNFTHDFAQCGGCGNIWQRVVVDISKAILHMASTLQKPDNQIPGTGCEKTLC
jgi:hypothetical protein